MKRSLLLLAIGGVFGIGGATFAHRHHDGESAKVVSRYNIQEKLDGKEASVSVVEVSFEPGQAGVPHRHPGPAFVYVVEGEYELGIDNLPSRVLKAGETFYEPSGCLHRVSKNASSKVRTRLIAFLLHPRDTREITVPEHKQE